MKSKKHFISIVVPAYNESAIIEDNYKEIKKEAEKLVKEKVVKDYEVLIANDGSTDNTEEILKKIAAKDKKLRPVIYYPNKGMGFAQRKMYHSAKGDIVIHFDADLSTKPDVMKEQIKWIDNGYDFVIASRYAGIQPKVPFYRWIPSRTYYLMNKLFLNVKIKDILSGFFAFRGGLLNGINLKSTDFQIHIEVLAKLEKLGYKVGEFPAVYIHRETGQKFQMWKHGPKTVMQTLRVWRKLKEDLKGIERVEKE